MPLPQRRARHEHFTLLTGDHERACLYLCDRWNTVVAFANQEPWTLRILGHPSEAVARVQLDEVGIRFDGLTAIHKDAPPAATSDAPRACLESGS